MAFVCTTLNMGTSGTAWHKVIKKTNKTSFSYYTPVQECMVEKYIEFWYQHLVRG